MTYTIPLEDLQQTVREVEAVLKGYSLNFVLTLPPEPITWPGDWVYVTDEAGGQPSHETIVLLKEIVGTFADTVQGASHPGNNRLPFFRRECKESTVVHVSSFGFPAPGQCGKVGCSS